MHMSQNLDKYAKPAKTHDMSHFLFCIDQQ